MDGPLKHIRAAALAAALVPLASVFAAPAAAQSACASGGVCGTVFNDTNGNNVQDAGDTGLGGVKVFICQICDGTDTIETETAPDGFLFILGDTGTWTVSVLIPTGYAAVTPDVCCNDAIDSDGVPDGIPIHRRDSLRVFNRLRIYDGVERTPARGRRLLEEPPGRMARQHITVGGVTYTKADAIDWLGKVGKDKTTTMFSSLVPAMLNVMIGNDGSCVNAAIEAGNAWMAITVPSAATSRPRATPGRSASRRIRRSTPTTTACSARRTASNPLSQWPARRAIGAFPSASPSESRNLET